MQAGVRISLRSVLRLMQLHVALCRRVLICCEMPAGRLVCTMIFCTLCNVFTCGSAIAVSLPRLCCVKIGISETVFFAIKCEADSHDLLKVGCVQIGKL